MFHTNSRILQDEKSLVRQYLIISQYCTYSLLCSFQPIFAAISIGVRLTRVNEYEKNVKVYVTTRSTFAYSHDNFRSLNKFAVSYLLG
jgi:hypothetical protein